MIGVNAMNRSDENTQCHYYQVNAQKNNSLMQPSARHSNSIDLIIDRFPHLGNHHQLQSELSSTASNSPVMQQYDNDPMSPESPQATNKHTTYKSIQNRSSNSKLSHSISLTQQLNNNCPPMSAPRQHSTASQHNPSSHNSGFLLGTFLKVWTRLKRPIIPGVGHKTKSTLLVNSNNQFEYISGDRIVAGASNQPIRQTLLLSNEDFRRRLNQSDANEKSNLKLISGSSSANNTGSSGVSSSSNLSYLQLHNNNNNNEPAYSPTSSTPSPSSAEDNNRPVTENTRPSNNCRRISAPSQLQMNSRNDPLISVRSHTNNCNDNKFPRRQKSLGQYNTQATLSERLNEEEDEDQQLSDVSGDDIYSTPNDSVISLQQVAQASNRSIVKSRSTNNFNPSSKDNDINMRSSMIKNSRQLEKIKDVEAKISSNSSENNKLIKINNNSRFFISSSSSEDSSAISNELSMTSKGENKQNSTNNSQHANENFQLIQNYHRQHHLQTLNQQHQMLEIPFSLGVHSHSISPPNSLLRTSPKCLVVQPTTNQLQTNLLLQCNGAKTQVPAMSPVELTGSSNVFTSFLQFQPNCSHRPPLRQLSTFHKKSPSLYDFQSHKRSVGDSSQDGRSRLGSHQDQEDQENLTSICSEGERVAPAKPSEQISIRDREDNLIKPKQTPFNNIPNSVSLYDCEFSMEKQCDKKTTADAKLGRPQTQDSEFKLAQMLLNMGSDLNVKDDDGFTALMYATLSDNFASIKCLVEKGANINETNRFGQNTLDLLCSKEPTETSLNMLKFFLSNGADRDAISEHDGSRLLDRLISLHQMAPPGNRSRLQNNNNNKLPYIDFLLQNGAKLGSSTWHAAYGKHEILLRLLKKLCQDGYFLYKTSSIEAAVYRFEYALKRVVELEYQIMMGLGIRIPSKIMSFVSESSETIQQSCLQLKYQTYLGLSRCELKRKFFKKALEYSQLAILIDSNAYEAYYSKALILKNMGDLDDALNTTNQSLRLIDKSIEAAHKELDQLREQQEEAIVIFDANCSNYSQLKENSELLESSRRELESMVEYLYEARRFISKLKEDIAREQ